MGLYKVKFFIMFRLFKILYIFCCFLLFDCKYVIDVNIEVFFLFNIIIILLNI